MHMVGSQACVALRFEFEHCRGASLGAEMLINSQISSDKLMSVVHARDYLSLVKDKGWYGAFYELQKRMPARAGQMFSDMLSARRAAWKYLLPMSRSAKVLCLGWGGSSVPIAMARSYKHVVVLEGTKESLESSRALADSEGLSNILYVNAVDSSALPLLDSCFDIVVINGVLDCVLSQDRDNARALQLEFLSEVLRVLGPCGVIYLGTGNRLSYTHLQEGLREMMTLFRAFTDADVLSRLEASQSGSAGAACHVRCHGKYNPVDMDQHRRSHRGAVPAVAPFSRLDRHHRRGARTHTVCLDFASHRLFLAISCIYRDVHDAAQGCRRTPVQ